jgi:NADPH-dependent glutamate synthase beta subunit-like oxidoreductase/Pyruvate/2-oxoacid:ferredoxin oxidoreductase delta subunit/bacterioferritin-associated ferredoxin
MNIPRFLRLYKEHRIEEAFESVILDNPLPASTGRVCQHPCENRCRRTTLDEAVNMREVHRQIADSVLFSDRFDDLVSQIASRKLDPTGRKVAVAGAGPAGLTAAFYLALMGHDVTVFDEKAEAGGMLRFAIPEYRLPKAVIRREVELIERMGVHFVFNTRVGFDLPLSDLADRFESVFISIGTWKESWPHLPGTELKGVYPALSFLESVAKNKQVLVGRKVVVIGGGNAANDSARTALRMGAEVTVLYRRERKDMPAIEEETMATEEEGAPYVFLCAPHRILSDPDGYVEAIEIAKTRLGERDKSGRRRPVPTGEIQRFECDTVILGIGESFDADFCRASGLALKEEGTIVVDRLSLETSQPGFYAGGDLIAGASNVSSAMGWGKQAARNIDARLMGEDRWGRLFPQFVYGQKAPEEPNKSRRHASHSVSSKVRVLSNEEVDTGLVPEEAWEEAGRCLCCDVRGRCATCVSVCPVLAVQTTKAGSTVTKVLIDEETCQGCTICVSRCPEHAIEMLNREHAFVVGTKIDCVTAEIEQICRNAHFYPDQVVCYCHRVQAKEVVAAILAGAKTPEEVAQATGARTGCGILCITGIIRLLEGSGLKLDRAAGVQWYGNPATIWTIPIGIKKKYPQYYLDADLMAVDAVFPKGEQE